MFENVKDKSIVQIYAFFFAKRIHTVSIVLDLPKRKWDESDAEIISLDMRKGGQPLRHMCVKSLYGIMKRRLLRYIQHHKEDCGLVWFGEIKETKYCWKPCRWWWWLYTQRHSTFDPPFACWIKSCLNSKETFSKSVEVNNRQPPATITKPALFGVLCAYSSTPLSKSNILYQTRILAVQLLYYTKC